MATTGCDGLAPAGTPGAFDAAVTPGPKYPTVTLDWSAPESAGDGPVTGYVVTRKGDKVSRTVGPDVRTFSWSGLEYQKAYTVTVTPMNARGAGPTRTLTATTAPYTPPTAPIDLVASYKTFERRIGLTWQPPADLGGAAVQKYDIYIDGQRWWTVWDGNATSVILPVNFGPKSWDVTMTATNRAGTSPKTPVSTVVVPRTPVNDYFGARTVLSGASGTTTGDNTYAGSQGGEPVPPADKPGAGDATVWTPGPRPPTARSPSPPPRPTPSATPRSASTPAPAWARWSRSPAPTTRSAHASPGSTSWPPPLRRTRSPSTASGPWPAAPVPSGSPGRPRPPHPPPRPSRPPSPAGP